MSDSDTVGEHTPPPFSHPPSLAATTRWHRAADRFLRRVSALGNTGLLAVILGGFLVANLLPDDTGIWLAAAMYLAAGGYCSVNFWRCREAHCVVTGIGLTVLGLGLLGAAVGIPTVLSEHEGKILLGVLAVAVGFEVAWRARYGTNAVRRDARETVPTE